MTIDRRGQAALEFLTTYGWAFLVIIVMIGAISYFGILNPSKLLPAKCAVSSEFVCDDYMITSTGGTGYGQLKIQLKQAIGKTIYLNNITCYYGEEPTKLVNSDASQGIFMNQNPPMSWSPKSSYTFTCDMPTDSVSSLKGQKAKIYFRINYQKSTTPGSLTHTADGETYAPVQ